MGDGGVGGSFAEGGFTIKFNTPHQSCDKSSHRFASLVKVKMSMELCKISSSLLLFSIKS